MFIMYLKIRKEKVGCLVFSHVYFFLGSYIILGQILKNYKYIKIFIF